MLLIVRNVLQKQRSWRCQSWCQCQPNQSDLSLRWRSVLLRPFVWWTGYLCFRFFLTWFSPQTTGALRPEAIVMSALNVLTVSSCPKMIWIDFPGNLQPSNMISCLFFSCCWSWMVWCVVIEQTQIHWKWDPGTTKHLLINEGKKKSINQSIKFNISWIQMVLGRQIWTDRVKWARIGSYWIGLDVDDWVEIEIEIDEGYG